MWTLVHKQLIHNTLLIVLGSKSAEDYQYLAEYQLLSGQRASPRTGGGVVTRWAAR